MSSHISHIRPTPPPTTLAASSAHEKVAVDSHERHQQGKSVVLNPRLARVAPQLEQVTQSSADCLEAGSKCLRRAQIQLENGDITMNGCRRTVVAMQAACEALMRMTADRGASREVIAAQALTAMLACADCEQECAKHKDHHAECKECFDACVACGASCRQLIAALGMQSFLDV